MKYCTKCGKPNYDDAAFCLKCGKRFEQELFREDEEKQINNPLQSVPANNPPQVQAQYYQESSYKAANSTPKNVANNGIAYKIRLIFFSLDWALMLALFMDIAGVICYFFFNYYLGLGMIAVRMVVCLVWELTHRYLHSGLRKLSACIFSVVLMILIFSYVELITLVGGLDYGFKPVGEQMVKDAKKNSGYVDIYELANKYNEVSKCL